MYVKTGTYVGNAGTNAITGFGFAPVAMWIRRHGASNAAAYVVKTGGVTHGKRNGANATDDGTAITLDADGFTLLSTQSEYNANLGNYDYIAWGADAADMAVFEYSGDTSDDRSVGSFTFTADFAFVLPSSTTRPHWRCDQTAGDLSHLRFDNVVAANGIQALQAGSLQVGTAINAAATDYYVAVFKKATNVLATTEYTGNGSDNRDVAHGLGVSPAFAYIQSQTVSNQVGVMRFGSDVGDVSHLVTAAADAADQIQSMDATNVNLGTATTVNFATGSPVYTLVTFGSNLPASGGSGGSLLLLGVG